jgi:diguanylate cyclase (GGDEF)-like protein
MEMPLIETILSFPSFGIYVVDIKTFELIYINAVLKKRGQVVPGKKCWETLYNGDDRCSFCAISQLIDADGLPNGRTVRFEYFSEIDDSWYQIEEQALFWPDGRIVKCSIAVDISHVKEIQNRLAETHAELSLANLKLEKISVTDPLTGLYNRVKLDKAFAREIARAERYGGPLSVILADIDKFKAVNDTRGHQAGDNTLCEFASILNDLARSTDIAGRWGGEEFLIICPYSGLDQAYAFAERIRSRIADHDFTMAGHRTCSFGVAAYRSGDKVETLVHRADVALYRAKQNGRNRVELEGDSAPAPAP